MASDRTSHDVVDGGGLYFARAVSAGPFVFLGGIAADETGNLVAEARVEPPYAVSPPAHAVAQTDFIFSGYKERLEALGSGINEVLQVEQYIPHKVYADAYIDTSRGQGYMDRGRPSSALLATGDLRPETCVINPTAVAVIPDGDHTKEIPSATSGYHENLGKESYGDTYANEGPFNEIVTAGGYVFTVGDIANDWEDEQIPDGVRASDNIWWGNEIRNETEFLLGRLKGWLEKVDSGLENVIHVSVYLIDIADLYELDRSWKKIFGDNLPARTVIPTRGLGTPRLEAEGLNHSDNAVKSEFIARSIRPGFGLEREVVSSGLDPITEEVEAVKAGNLLWLSGQYAGGVEGPGEASTADQLKSLMGQLDATCKAGGTTIDRLVRLRAFLTDPDEAPLVYEALKKAVPSDPPTVVVSGVPAPFPVPGATVLVDAVAAV